MNPDSNLVAPWVSGDTRFQHHLHCKHEMSYSGLEKGRHIIIHEIHAGDCLCDSTSGPVCYFCSVCVHDSTVNYSYWYDDKQQAISPEEVQGAVIWTTQFSFSLSWPSSGHKVNIRLLECPLSLCVSHSLHNKAFSQSALKCRTWTDTYNFIYYSM